ncbi:WD40-repeat-containing domain protein [Hyaloraphidium curvatum]|nr:WD40-repeat-containing domain protein [Hyaloraphidium curvatum]
MTMRPQDIQQSLLYGQFQPNVGQQFQNAGQQFQNAMQMMRNPAGMADPMTMAFGGPRPPSDDLGMSGFANANGGRLPENANFDELSSWLTNNGETENLNAGWNRSNGGNQVDYGMGALSAELFHQSGRLGPGEENMIVDVGSVSDLSSGLIKGGRISPELGGPGEPEAGSDGPARLVASLKAHSQKVSACAFDFAGRVLASGGHDRKVAVWDVRPDADMAAPIWTLDGHTNQVNCARFSNVCMVLRNGAPMPSSSSRAAISGMPVLLATGSMDKTVRIHIVQGLLPDRVSLEAELGAPFLRSFSEHKASVTSVDFCPIAIAGADGLEVELPLDGTTARIDVLCASVDGDGEVKLWSAVTGRVEKSILLPLRAAYATNCVRFRPASHWVPPGTGSRAGKGGPKGILATVACAVANQLNLIELALPSSQTDSPLSNAASPKTVNHRNVGAASVSGHTGVTFSSGDDEYSIRIYSTPHAKNINSVDWSNDGSYLVTASEDVVCVWEVGTAGMPDSGCTVAFQIPLSTGKIASCVILQDAARAGLPSTAADEPATPSSPTRARSRPPRIAFGDYDRFYIWNPPSAGSSAASQAVVPSVQSGNIGCLASVGAWDGTVKADPVTVDENPHLLHQEPRDILLAAGSSAREDNLKLWSVQQRDA